MMTEHSRAAGIDSGASYGSPTSSSRNICFIRFHLWPTIAPAIFRACRFLKMSAGWVKLEQEIIRSNSSERARLTLVQARSPRPQQSCRPGLLSPGPVPHAPATEVTPVSAPAPALRQHERGDGHGARRAGLPGRRRPGRDDPPGPGRVPARPGAARRGQHRDPGPGPGRVHRRPRLHRRRRLQPHLLADPPDPHHQGRRPRPPGLVPPGGRPPPGHRRAGRGRRAHRLDGRHHLPVDRQDPGLVPGRRRPDPDRRGAGRGPAAGPGRAGRRDLRPLPPRHPRTTTRRVSRTARSPSRPPFTARA